MHATLFCVPAARTIGHRAGPGRDGHVRADRREPQRDEHPELEHHEWPQQIAAEIDRHEVDGHIADLLAGLNVIVDDFFQLFQLLAAADLRGFERIHLKPGETKTVTFTLTRDDLALWDRQMHFVVEPGKFASWIAPPRVGIDNKPGDFEYVKIAA